MSGGWRGRLWRLAERGVLVRKVALLQLVRKRVVLVDVLVPHAALWRVFEAREAVLVPEGLRVRPRGKWRDRRDGRWDSSGSGRQPAASAAAAAAAGELNGRGVTVEEQR